MISPNASAVDVVIERVSPLRLGDPGPNDEVLNRIISAGLRAPDHGQLRPWKFLIIRGDARARFGELLAASFSRRDPTATEASLQAERSKAARAPIIIVVAARPRETTRIPAVEQIVSAGAAVQNMLIAAHASGYGGFWRTGPAAYDRRFAEALGLGEGDAIVGFVYIGTVVTPGKAKYPDPANVVEEWSGAAGS
jgi:nitroreductase